MPLVELVPLFEVVDGKRCVVVLTLLPLLSLLHDTEDDCLVVAKVDR